jgi:hypothetical protein
VLTHPAERGPGLQQVLLLAVQGGVVGRRLVGGRDGWVIGGGL